MKVDASDQLQVLTRERARLADVLEREAGWRALRDLADREARGEWVDGAQRAAERARLETELSVNTTYLAWRKLGEVIRLLEPSTPAPLVAAPPEPETEPKPVATQRPDASPLLRIKGMDESTARQLADAGVTGLAQIAAWTAKDVKSLRKQLGLGRRLSQEGWIEQAALLLKQDEAKSVQVPRVPESPAAKTASPEKTVGPARASGGSAAIEDPPATVTVTGAAESRVAAAASGDEGAVSVSAKIDRVADAEPTAEEPAPEPVRFPPASPVPSAATAPSGKPSSLTARLFARTPITGPQQSLLAAIEAAEQARLRPAHVAGEVEGSTSFTDARDSSQSAGIGSVRETTLRVQETSSHVGSPPLGKQVEPPVEIAIERSRPRPGPAPERPVVAAIDDEAEVAIIKRSAATAPVRPPERKADDVIFPVDHEAQGGEDIDPRNIAAYRGNIEEASVEIVVRRSSRKAVPAEGKTGTDKA